MNNSFQKQAFSSHTARLSPVHSCFRSRSSIFLLTFGRGSVNFTILIHEYDDVDLHIVWEAVHTDLPPLIATIEGLLEQI